MKAKTIIRAGHSCSPGNREEEKLLKTEKRKVKKYKGTEKSTSVMDAGAAVGERR